MNGDAERNDLARLNDEDISLLYTICKRASLLDLPTYKGLFEAYHDVLEEEGRSREHDATIFRVLVPIGEETRIGENTIDVLTAYKRLLVANQIYVFDGENGELTETTRSIADEIPEYAKEDKPTVNGYRRPKPDKRRVSFDDARLEETWLSETADLSRPLGGLLSQPARRFPANRTPRRASISTHHDLSLRQPTLNHFRQAGHRQLPAPIQDYPTETETHEKIPTHLAPFGDRRNHITKTPEDAHANPTLLFDPSKTHLENDAYAFAYISEVRIARKCLSRWRDAAFLLRDNLAQAQGHDQQALRKQAFDQWRDASAYERNVILHARGQILQRRSFQGWRAKTDENLTKSRSILTRKFLTGWYDRLAKRDLHYEQAQVFREETRLRRCCQDWYWQLVERRVEAIRAGKVRRLSFDAWKLALRRLEEREAQADRHLIHRSAVQTLDCLRQRSCANQQNLQAAAAHHSRALKASSICSLTTQVKLKPLARAMTLQVELILQRKAFKVWHLHLTMTRQSADVDCKRVMQSAWTSWNDALRCQALAQKINERLLVENLYRWVLQERSRLSLRANHQRLARSIFTSWIAKARLVRDPLEYAEKLFLERQQRRRMACSMNRLHAAMRAREDQERASVEFANSRLFPSILSPWSKQVAHISMLGKWAVDARFFTLTTNAIKVWHERTEQHKVERRRNAYIQVRARIKIRLAGSCLTRMRERCAERRALEMQAQAQSQRRLFVIGAAGFDHWRELVQNMAGMKQVAATVDSQRLLGSALAALFSQVEASRALDLTACDFQRDTDLDLLGSVVKKMQWVAFTSARRGESAEALWVRNRNSHVRRMIRVWQAQATSRRAQRTQHDDPRGRHPEPDSPSLRPASRAASRSAQRSAVPLPAPQEAHTPAYLRTPSRSRKVGRFRTALPTPAPLTPFNFDPAYLTTTPNPLGTVVVQQEADTVDEPFSLRTTNTALSPQRAHPPDRVVFDALTPQVTPFSRKLRAGGFGASIASTTPAGLPPALRSSVFGPVPGSGTTKSVRFSSTAGPRAPSRFQRRRDEGL